MSAGRAGFTLIEILMVILLIGVLSAVALPQFIDFRTDAKIAVTNEKLNELKMAIVGDSRMVANGVPLKPGFIANIGNVPTNLNDLINQGSYPAYNPLSRTGWNGPYVDRANTSWNLDAWGTTIQYNGTARSITSCGSNSTCGNADDLSISF